MCSRLRFQRLLLTASRAFSDQSLLLPLSATIPCGKTETEIRVQTQLPSGKYFTPCDTNEYSFATDGESRSFCDSPYKIEFIGKNRTRHSVEMGEGRYLGMLLLVECVYCACQHFLLHRFFFFCFGTLVCDLVPFVQRRISVAMRSTHNSVSNGYKNKKKKQERKNNSFYGRMQRWQTAE